MSTAARVFFEFDGSYARDVPDLSVPWTAASFPAPRLLLLNEPLAAELGVEPDALRAPEGLGLLVGAVPEGVVTTAQAYAGHQFGGYVPRLGDGRALLLGEVLDTGGHRRDLHLKGSGRTPFARGGDGKAAVGPMLREYLMGEAMHALGIPTTRALAVVATGEPVARETMLPGAVLTRVAASHLRVGTFQYAAAIAAASGGTEVLRALAAHAIARHHPEAAGAANPYLEFYRRVIEAQAALVARWMLVGFVHGVMNTDNMTISGETIDYGPCAFLDGYHPSTVFSSIDANGRYAYGNQPPVAQWNLARLAEALLPLIDPDPEAAVAAATDAVNGFAGAYRRHWSAGMAAKLGLTGTDTGSDPDLVTDLLTLLGEQRADFTGFFRALSEDLRGRGGPIRSLFGDPAAFDRWAERWRAALGAAGSGDRPARETVAAEMDRVNPVYVPRNHLVEEALAAATAGDLGPVERLLEVLARPFDERPGYEVYASPAPAGCPPHVTYCGT